MTDGHRPPRVSVALQTDKTATDYARLAIAAEAAGLDGVSVFADLGFQPPGPALAVIAEHTSRVRLGVACYNPWLTHPVHIAAEVAALQRLSGGRCYVGLARGAWLDRVGVAGGGLVALAEAIDVVAAVLAGDDHGYAGTHFRIAPGFRLVDPPGSTPLLVGTWGSRTAALAGRHGAAEIKVGGAASAAAVRRIAAAIDGPGPVGARPGIVLGAVTVCDPDGRAARARARAEVAMYLDVVAGLDPGPPIDPDALSRMRAALRSGDLTTAAAAVPDEALARFAFAGTPDEIAGQAAGLVQAGVDRIEFGTPHGLEPAVAIDLLGRRVAPAVREVRG